MDPLELLGEDIWVKIVMSVDVTSLARCMWVCNAWRERAKSPVFWRPHCEALWQGRILVARLAAPPNDHEGPSMHASTSVLGPEAFSHSLTESRRTSITPGDLCQFTWDFRFRWVMDAPNLLNPDPEDDRIIPEALLPQINPRQAENPPPINPEPVPAAPVEPVEPEELPPPPRPILDVLLHRRLTQVIRFRDPPTPRQTMLRYFQPDGSIRSGPSDPLFGEHENRWKIKLVDKEEELAKREREGGGFRWRRVGPKWGSETTKEGTTRVIINSWPALEVLRDPVTWGWELQNPWVKYTTVGVRGSEEEERTVAARGPM
eukprot:TRINITY_DN5653_c3_g1_i1.p1 TRINITY_DN5653_c3_g1~~TRINITY_DN5653_c3_g1_i1.p1  ORF type:complete len:318 (-),score=38.77 TRINITY_DN5653_c3_g1_i1:2056-3009(-)